MIANTNKSILDFQDEINSLDIDNKPSLELAQQINLELDALEKNIVNGWNTQYPTLFAVLTSIIKKFAMQSNISAPGLGIVFHGIHKNQAHVILTARGIAQLNIGVLLIRELFLSEKTDKYRAFFWIIGHEISHLNDSMFILYAKLYPLGILFQKTIGWLLLFGVITWLNPDLINRILGMHLNKTIGSYIIVLGVGLLILRKIFYLCINRIFEYKADKLTVALINNFSINDTLTSLNFIYNNIRNFIADQLKINKNTNFLRLYFLQFYKNIYFFYIKHTHPSVNNRIQKLKKHLLEK